MLSSVTIREYGSLAYHGESGGLDFAVIDKHAWCWLKEICLNRTDDQSEFLRLISKGGNECLQVRNYVGVLETPSGLQIEIVPKTTQSGNQNLVETRKLLWKMLARVNKVPWVESEEAHLRTANRPIIEILIYKFLSQVATIVKRGIRNDYIRVQEEQRFLRGRLDVCKQIRRPPSQRHIFDIQYDKYQPNRAENRLIKSALRKSLTWSKTASNQRLARELLFAFDAIPYSDNISRDFSQWRDTRDMVYYRQSKPWCQLILSEQSPFFSTGSWKGISLLFPMEQLFEEYVENQLNQQIERGYSLSAQARGQSLVRHENQDWFALRPDILIRKENKAIVVLDTKWKLIDSRLNDSSSKYQISQSDMYQLFAYGQKYLDGIGDLYLIYPKHAHFERPLAQFEFAKQLRLWAVPYDLESDQILIPDTCDLKNILKHKQWQKVA